MIEISSIEDIKALRESSDLECKLAQGRDGKGAFPKDVWETYSAFANTRGGNILLGLKENKDRSFELKGVDNPDKVLDEFWTSVNNLQKVSCNLMRECWVKLVAIDGCTLLQIYVPAASRTQKPVYLNNNPLTGTYKRLNSGDMRLTEEAVKRMLAEQVEDSRDTRLMRGFTLEDLDADSINAFRQLFRAYKADHPWLALDDLPLLQRLGCWYKDRGTGEEGLTLAALIMFGQHRPIHEALPNYMLDYQELPDDTRDQRWLDRVVPDGTWSGNIFDFYRKIIGKLEADLKQPFLLKNNVRQDDTLVHQALREALINCLVHADYSERASVKVVKSPKGFYFRNPGDMRIPPEIALVGGESDCRNRTLHAMFLLLGLGERAGSGLPKIHQGWTSLGHSLDLVESVQPFLQTEVYLNWAKAGHDGVNDRVNDGVNDGEAQMPEIQRQILRQIKANSQSTVATLANATGKSPRTIERHLKALRESQHIERVGPDKTGHWKVIE